MASRMRSWNMRRKHKQTACLNAFVVLASYVFVQSWDLRNIIRSCGYEIKSEGQRRSSQIGVIGDMSADVVILYV